MEWVWNAYSVADHYSFQIFCFRISRISRNATILRARSMKGNGQYFTKPSPSAFVVHTVPRREREPGAAVGRMRIRCCRDDGFVGQIPEIKVSVDVHGRCREEKEVECGLSSRHHRMSLASFDRSPATQSINQFADGGILGRAHWAWQGGRRWHIFLWSLSFYSQKM